MNVSFLVCTFGSHDWEEQGRAALDSALTQDPFEAFALHYPDGSLAEVRNDAARQAAGDWICYVDGDDRLGDGYLGAMQAAAANLPDVGNFLLVPSVQYVRDGKCVGEAAIPACGEDPDAARRMIEINCAVVGTLVPRALFLEAGGFRDTLNDGTLLTSLEDWDLWLRCQIIGARLVPVPAAVYCATMKDGGRNADQSPYAAIRAELEPAWREAVLGH